MLLTMSSVSAIRASCSFGLEGDGSSLVICIVIEGILGFPGTVFSLAAATSERAILRTELSSSACASEGRPSSEGLSSPSSSESVWYESISRNSARILEFLILSHDSNQYIMSTMKGKFERMKNQTTYVLTRTQLLPPSATTSTFTPSSFECPFLLGATAFPLCEYVAQMAVTGGVASKTSFHTEIKYGAFVERAGSEAQLGSARNYYKLHVISFFHSRSFPFLRRGKGNSGMRGDGG